MVAFPGEDNFLIRDIRIEQGRIVEIDAGLAGHPDASSEDDIDVEGHWVLPGGIDLQVQFFKPRYTYKDNFPPYEYGKGIVADAGHGSFIIPRRNGQGA